MKRLVALLLMVLAMASPAWAEEQKALKGVALVIGQSKYVSLPALTNPAHDAKDIQALLEELGFEVTGVTDRDSKKLRRDLERFSEDADGADVAIVYYSGHGIEAGGEDWLVPTDANKDSLADLGKSLVPLTGILDEIKSKVQVTIILIDACRDNPFPPGALAKQDGETVEVGKGGLGVPRGFSSVADAPENDSIGTVIGFAAEPGRPALDGKPGTNSPYAAAILRHLSALQGEEFGLVMRMVTEEVYLKTKARQRPWTNESLRRLLYFGAPPDQPKGPEGEITTERRKLLLTISDLPTEQRQEVEKIAEKDAIPLDILFAVLRAIGASDIPTDPDALAAALQQQAQRIKAMLEEREALSTDDPKLAELSADADRAVEEGAIDAARKFLEEAKQEVEKSRGLIEDTEAKLKAKRIANGEILVKSAEIAELQFDYKSAITDYAAAADWVRDADAGHFTRYLTYQADALQLLGAISGDRRSFTGAITVYAEAIASPGALADAILWSKATNNLANTYLRIGEIEVGTAELEQAIRLYRDVLAKNVLSPDLQPVTRMNLANALHSLGERKNDLALYDEAAAAYAEALKGRDRDKDPEGWASTVLNMANLEVDLGDRRDDLDRIVAARHQIEQALTIVNRARNPWLWGQAMNNLGVAIRIEGSRKRDLALLKQAVEIYRQALAVFDRKRFAADWGSTMGNLAIAETHVGVVTLDMHQIEEATHTFEAAMGEISRARAPNAWANLMNTYGMALEVVGQSKGDTAMMEKAARAFREVLEVRTRERDSVRWADTENMLGQALAAIASQKNDVALFDEAERAYRAALEVFTRDKFPSDWNQSMTGLAGILQSRGILAQSVTLFEEAMKIYDELLAATPRDTQPLDWANTMKNIGVLQFMIGTTRHSRDDVLKAIASFDAADAEYQKAGDWLSRMMIANLRKTAMDALATMK